MKKRNGSVVIVTLFTCIILSAICLGCIEMVKTNSSMFFAKEKSLKLKYDAKSGLNLALSKVLEDVKNKEEDKLNIQDILETDKARFINDIESISDKDLKVKIINNDIYLENQFIRFDISSQKEDGDFKKRVMCSVKINLNKNEIKRVHVYNYKEI